MSRILIVDDLESDRLLMDRLLTEKGTIEAVHAADGQEALQIIRESLPDAVITDMKMPNLGGLELVTAIGREFPSLPVVLVTSLGSEETAAEALRRGAATYLPKDKLFQSLEETVAGVLQVSSGARENAKLKHCIVRQQRNQEYLLHNDRSLFTPLVNLVQQHVIEMGICNEACGLQVGIALDEALVNALYHGNLELDSQLREEDEKAYYELARERIQQEPYRDRRIRFLSEINQDSACFTLEDDGPGFNPGTLPDPTNPENLTNLTGRGILLMQTFMDDITFNERGNKVVMVKRRATESHI